MARGGAFVPPVAIGGSLRFSHGRLAKLQLRHGRWINWLTRRPLAIFLPIGAALFLFRLDLLPLWGDEHTTLRWIAMPARELGVALHHDIHPPLYFVLLRWWMKLPHTTTDIAHARALSGIFALGVLVLLDRTWLRRIPLASRWWVMALLTFSPLLLLFGRMARSYSLQMLFCCAVLFCAGRLLEAPRDRRALGYYAILGTLLFYTHYLPATAVVVSFAALLALRYVRRRDPVWLVPLIVPHLLIALAYAPILPSYARALEAVATSPSAAPVSGLTAVPVDLAYTFVTFNFGETLPVWGLVGSAILVPALVPLLARGAAPPPAWLPLVLGTTVLAFAGANRWVSFAFVPVRILYALPFYFLILVRGCERSSRLGRLVCTGLLVVAAGSIGSYFRSAGFFNKGYVVPFGRIAAEVVASQGPDVTTTLFLDHYRTNVDPVQYYLPSRIGTVLLHHCEAERSLWESISDGQRSGFLLLRRTLGTPEAGCARDLEARAAERCRVTRSLYQPYSALDRAVLRLSGRGDQTHAIELLAVECRDRPVPEPLLAVEVLPVAVRDGGYRAAPVHISAHASRPRLKASAVLAPTCRSSRRDSNSNLHPPTPAAASTRRSFYARSSPSAWRAAT